MPGYYIDVMEGGPSANELFKLMGRMRAWELKQVAERIDRKRGFDKVTDAVLIRCFEPESAVEMEDGS